MNTLYLKFECIKIIFIIVEDLMDLIYKRAYNVYGLINLDVVAKIGTRTFPEHIYENCI